MNVAVGNAAAGGSEEKSKEIGQMNGSISNIEEPDASLQSESLEEEDEEVRVAMALALAAAQNPRLSPDQLHKLVLQQTSENGAATSNTIHQNAKQQQEIVAKKKQEQAQKRWEEQKRQAVQWWKGTVQDVQTAAANHTQALKDQAERRRYADVIRKDVTVQELKQNLKMRRKTLKAHRLRGNRVETRHAFKRQRMERHLMQTTHKLHKAQVLLTGESFNTHAYAKAMLKASAKWHKESNTQEELSLEAQLCRNMHQMLTIEKQKSKVKKETRDVRKYLQRCKGWLDDKRALCEMNLLTMEATSNSMVNLYKETIEAQEACIAKILAGGDRNDGGDDNEQLAAIKAYWDLLPKDVITDSATTVISSTNPATRLSDIAGVDVSCYTDIPPGVESTLRAMRGLPMLDPVQATKEKLERVAKAKAEAAKATTFQKQQSVSKKPAPASSITASASPAVTSIDTTPPAPAEAAKPELYIETHDDDNSISSHLSDPDNPDGNNLEDDAKSGHSLDFGQDAPWVAGGDDTGSHDTSSRDSQTPPLSSSSSSPRQQRRRKKPVSAPVTEVSTINEDAASLSSSQQQRPKTITPQSSMSLDVHTATASSNNDAANTHSSDNNNTCTNHNSKEDDHSLMVSSDNMSMGSGIKSSAGNSEALMGSTIPSNPMYMSHTEVGDEDHDDDQDIVAAKPASFVEPAAVPLSVQADDSSSSGSEDSEDEDLEYSEHS